MATIPWIILAVSFILSDVTGSLLRPKLIRTKRWEGNGDMNGGGGDGSNMFRGTAGVDYPDLKSIPTTSFKCSEQEFEGGLYADVEAQCQVYHVCHDGRKDSFLCGRGTVFNQQILACDYWYSTECDTAPSYYYLNAQIGGSDTSWVPPQGNPQYDNQGNPQYDNQRNSQYNNQGDSQYNNQGNNYQGYDPNAQGLTGNAGPGQSENGQKPCCCLKNNYVAPWNFPSH